MNWNSKEFICFEEGCGRIFNTNWTLKRHSAIHQQIKNSTYKCEECDKSFSRKDSLDRHHQICHNSEIVMYMCPEVNCGKLFSLKSTLYRHMFSHTGTYRCEECGNSFTRKDNLARHKITHAENVLKKRMKLKKLSQQSKSLYTQELNKKQTVENMEYNDNRGDHTYSIFAG